MSDALIAMIAAVVGGLVALWTFERQARLSHVTVERAAWRSRIRSVAADLLVGSAGGTPDGRDERDEDARMRAAVTLQLSTNPYDPLDREIVELAFRIAGTRPGDEADRGLFALRVQLLLKHDWERAKIEAGWRNPVTQIWRRCTGKKEGSARASYDRFVDWRMRHSVEIDRRLPPP